MGEPVLVTCSSHTERIVNLQLTITDRSSGADSEILILLKSLQREKS